ncbi:hypothetical protein ABZS61_21520 [Streptomyces sp. NPDC005566]|uniref:hypothetical protein n=1 Tax=Streptomyces sp. NPDC005566 TaxID=3156886 RepID=UPI0033B39734
MSESESGGALPQQAQDIAAGYEVSGAALELGALLWDGAALPGSATRPRRSWTRSRRPCG